MSGLYRGKVEQWQSNGARVWNAQALFYNLYNFWLSHPNATMIASNYGLPQTVTNVAFTVNVPFSVTNGSPTVTTVYAQPTYPTIQAGSVLYFSTSTTTYQPYTVSSVSAQGTIITLSTNYVGSTSAAATATVLPGTTLFDGYQPFGQDAWFVVRLNATAARAADVYHLFQWLGYSSATPQGQGFIAPGLPGVVAGVTTSVSGNCIIAHAAGIGIGGTGGSSLSVSNGYGNPWKGTTNNNGADFKTPALSGTFSVTSGSTAVTSSVSGAIVSGSTIAFSNASWLTYTVTGSGTSWTLGSAFEGVTNGAVTAASVGGTTGAAAVWGTPSGGGTGSLLFPRSNGASGSFASQANNMGYLAVFPASDITPTRCHIVADDDSFAYMTDQSDSNGYFVSYSGLFNARPNAITPIPLPYLVIDSGDSAAPWTTTVGTVYGDSAGTAVTQGGIVSASVSNGVRSLQLDALPVFTGDTSFSPNRNFTNLTFDEFDVFCGAYETSYYGLLGQIDWIRFVVNVQTNYTRSDFTRIFCGASGVASTKMSCPWDSENDTVPRSGISITGVNFVTTGNP